MMFVCANVCYGSAGRGASLGEAKRCLAEAMDSALLLLEDVMRLMAGCRWQDAGGRWWAAVQG